MWSGKRGLGGVTSGLAQPHGRSSGTAAFCGDPDIQSEASYSVLPSFRVAFVISILFDLLWQDEELLPTEAGPRVHAPVPT